MGPRFEIKGSTGGKNRLRIYEQSSNPGKVPATSDTRRAVYGSLHAIYEKHRRKYRGAPNYMWSGSNPPDVLEFTRPIASLAKAFDICIDEDDAVALFDMDLDQATDKIIEMRKKQKEDGR
jgi:hypothetical protein